MIINKDICQYCTGYNKVTKDCDQEHCGFRDECSPLCKILKNPIKTEEVTK